MMGDILIRVLPTPNPNAWKFVINKPVLNEGKATFAVASEALGLKLVEDLFDVVGVSQIHLFTNVITITCKDGTDSERFKEEASAVIQTRMWLHDPNYNQQEQKKQSGRQNHTPEMNKIEEILDMTIRPGLQGDGGDIEIVALEGKRLIVRYQGACGTCPSAMSGTLMAIEGILHDEYDPELEVIPV